MSSTQDIKRLIAEIQNRIQFLATIEIFFLGFLYSYFKIGGVEEAKSIKNSIVFGLAVVISIINYLMIGTLERAKRDELIFLQRTVSTNLILFVPLIFSLFLDINIPLKGYLIWVPVICLYAVSLASFLILFTIIYIQFLQDSRKR